MKRLALFFVLALAGCPADGPAPPPMQESSPWEVVHAGRERKLGGYTYEIVTRRMKVPNGWLYRVSNEYNGLHEEVVFVPDPFTKEK